MGEPGHLDNHPGRGLERDVVGIHVPVLLQSVLEFLNAGPGGTYLDGTVGGGGHAAAILQASAPQGRLLGLDRDPVALETARQRLVPFGERATLRHGSFARLKALALGFTPADGVLLDLGLSSIQLADPLRGFSFAKDGPLDMRFDPSVNGPTAADLVNDLSVKDLVDILYRYGEEKQARRIAGEIAANRPLHTTTRLAEVVANATGGRRKRIHPATRTFQALRIAVNRELEALEEVLPQALDLLAVGGRLVVISFHSLEDRIVKRYLRHEASDCVCPTEVLTCVCGHRARVRILTSRPVRPCADEIEANPRSRSARLRAAERLPEQET